MKSCTICKVLKEDSEFSRRSDALHRFVSCCRKCKNSKLLARYHANKHRTAEEKLAIKQAREARRASPNKWCPRCKTEKSKDQFYARLDRPKELRCWCKVCHVAASWACKKLRLEKAPESTRTKLRDVQMRCRYGIGLEDRNRMFSEQEGRCAICQAPFTEHGRRGLYIDHNHTTKKVRGLLCRLCNSAVGMLRDSAMFARRTADYLEKHS